MRAFDGEGEIGTANGGDGAEVVEIIAVERDVEGAEGGGASAILQDGVDAAAENGATGVDADEGEGIVRMGFDDLCGDALDFVPDVGGGEQGFFAGFAHGRIAWRERPAERDAMVVGELISSGWAGVSGGADTGGRRVDRTVTAS